MDGILEGLIKRTGGVAGWAYTHSRITIRGKESVCPPGKSSLSLPAGDRWEFVRVRGVFSSLREAKHRLRCEIHTKEYYASRLLDPDDRLAEDGGPSKWEGASDSECIDALLEGREGAEINFDLNGSRLKAVLEQRLAVHEEWGADGGGITLKHNIPCSPEHHGAHMHQILRFQVEPLKIDPESPGTVSRSARSMFCANRFLEAWAFETVMQMQELAGLIEAFACHVPPVLHLLHDSRPFFDQDQALCSAAKCIAAFSSLDDAVAAMCSGNTPDEDWSLEGWAATDNTMRVQTCEVDGERLSCSSPGSPL